MEGKSEKVLYERVVEILEGARSRAARSVNVAMVEAYWRIGSEIVQVEQLGKRRAGYGKEVIAWLAVRLQERHTSDLSRALLMRIRQSYLTFPQGSALSGENNPIVAALPRQSAPGCPSPFFPSELGWTHYTTLMTVRDPLARSFYEIEAAREGWSTRELERQIASLLFERLARSRNREQVLALARRGQEIATPEDVLKEPLVLEFLDVAEQPLWRERGLESALIDRLSAFMLELGKGFCFVGRQKRITLDGDHYFVDLVFYHRLLRCFVLLDLKMGKLTHQDLGQMRMYVNWFDRFQRVEGEEPTIGIVLCSEKNDAMVSITLPDPNERVVAARYQLYLPTEEELRVAVARERREAERALGVERPPAR